MKRRDMMVIFAASVLAGSTLYWAVLRPLVYAKQGDMLRGTVKVIDGDTIELQGQRVRLWGVDAPENDTPAGIAATHFLRLYLKDKRVTCLDTGHRTYGRWVSTCFVIEHYGITREPGWTDLGRVLVRRRHAVPVERFSGGYYR